MTIEASSLNKSSPGCYGRVAQAIHWLTAILVLIAFIYGPGGPEDRVYAAARDAERHLHETLGSCVFALVVVRVLWRLVDSRPDPVPVARWMGLAAKAVQGLLYLLMFAVPMTAIAGAWLEGHPLAYLGGFEIASPIAPSHELGATLADIHGWLGDVILWVAGAHALAAIWHHFIARDAVLVAMLPAWLIKAPKRRA
ncbi:MAG: cytochrome b [Betaproteobacteria bacterium]